MAIAALFPHTDSVKPAPVFIAPDASAKKLAGSLVPLKNGADVSVLCIPEGKIFDDVIADVIEGKIVHRTIIAEARSRSTVFLTLKSAETVIEVFVGKEAQLTIICLQDSAMKSVITQKSRVDEGGSIRWQNVTTGPDVTQKLSSEITGANATSDIDWVFRANDKQKQSLSARNIFSARDGGGEITLKGVAEGSGYAECDGMIEITEQGGGTDTYLTEDVLMLDPAAKVDAVPGLEIRTNDVKASHSATVSRVTTEDLFYFQSRGITEETAKEMFTEGFLSALLDRIVDETIRSDVKEMILR